MYFSKLHHHLCQYSKETGTCPNCRYLASYIVFCFFCKRKVIIHAMCGVCLVYNVT